MLSILFYKPSPGPDALSSRSPNMLRRVHCIGRWADMLGRIVIGALMLFDAAGSTVAATTHDFYKGKTVKILVGA